VKKRESGNFPKSVTDYPSEISSNPGNKLNSEMW